MSDDILELRSVVCSVCMNLYQKLVLCSKIYPDLGHLNVSVVFLIKKNLDYNICKHYLEGLEIIQNILK